MQYGGMTMSSDFEYIVDTVRAWLTTTPKTQKELESITGIDRRIIRRAIRQLRMDGLKVCSGNDGYWIWNGEDSSWEMTKATIVKKAAHTFELLNAMKAHEGDDDQLTFGEVSA